jgi:excisionase family DNA binding protein
MAVPEVADPVGQSTNAIARLLVTDMREDLLAIMREIVARNAFGERLAYSPDEAAELLGISRELVHDLLRTGQLGSVKAGRRRLIAKLHLEAFLAGEQCLRPPPHERERSRLTFDSAKERMPFPWRESEGRTIPIRAIAYSEKAISQPGNFHTLTVSDRSCALAPILASNLSC